MIRAVAGGGYISSIIDWAVAESRRTSAWLGITLAFGGCATERLFGDLPVDAGTLDGGATFTEAGTSAAADAGNVADAGSGITPSPGCDSGPGACVPGLTESVTEACGNCGTRTKSRTCTEACVWEEWDVGDCSAEGCSVGASSSRTVDCPCGGSKQQVQMCNDECGWGEWVDVGTCELYCCAEVVFCNTRHNSEAATTYPGRGTWCKQTGCSQDEALADCLSDVSTVCGEVVSEFFIEYK